MLEITFALLIATILGFLAGMGVGGGSLLLLWLTQVVMMPQEQAKILNLLFYLPAAMAATVFGRHRKTIQADVTVPALAAGCSAAVLFSVLGQNWDILLLKKLLGGILILTGLREIFYRPR